MAATGTPTPNIGLRRAQGTDPASVDDINYNSALIDTKLGAVGNSSVQDQIDTLNSKLEKSGTLLASKTTESASYTGSIDTTGYSALIVNYQAKNSGAGVIVYPIASIMNNINIGHYIHDTTSYWSYTVFKINNGTYTLAYDMKGSSVAVFSNMYIYGII